MPMSAVADGLANVKWCEANTEAPSQAHCMAKTMPDGNLHGTHSAATLIGEARAAARSGNCDAAISWAVECQCHNSGAADEIRADRDAVCGYLK
ncbi:MAG: hypothetical protein Q8K85_05575 [Hyphomicrobium sp.]|nr:hypothetical protein [Hyphomicrobium sp.]